MQIAPEGKKWSLHYYHNHNGGEKWGFVFNGGGNEKRSGDYPHLNERSDILTFPHKCARISLKSYAK